MLHKMIVTFEYVESEILQCAYYDHGGNNLNHIPFLQTGPVNLAVHTQSKAPPLSLMHVAPLKQGRAVHGFARAVGKMEQ